MQRPSEPGWWWVMAYGIKATARIHETMSVTVAGFCNPFRVDDKPLVWLEPVATPDQRRQAVEAMDAAETLLSHLRGCPPDGAEVSRVVGLLQSAIAAMCGEGEA